jgi:uroporphyrinogen III methyltransferase/synthase
MNSQSKTGTVYLVGAGPGDPDLITVKGSRLLEQCDIVVYDNLVPYEIVVTLPAGVERRYVGKKAGQHSLAQNEINELLAALAFEGKNIVRLKGGDPFVFGRGGEEVQFLRERDIPVVVVPGITSGIAAPAYADIACTGRRHASFVMFLTGHKASEKEFSTVPWDWVGKARNGTLVVYMGVAETETIVTKLLEAGMSPETPVAAIERGTFPTQRTVTTSLSKLSEQVRILELRPPTLFVIGDAAKKQETIDQLRQRPLFGVRVMVLRPADQAKELYRSLRDHGAEVLPYPTISTEEEFDASAWEQLKNSVGGTRWLIFTSENGVRYFMKQWHDMVGDVRRLGEYKIAAVGSGTSRALAVNHLKPDFVPTTATTAAMAEQMADNLDLSGASVIRVRGNLGDDRVEKIFREAGANVVPLPTYRTFFVKWTNDAREKLFAFPPDVIIFTSGSTADGLARNLSNDELKKLTDKALIETIGPSTSEVVQSHGMRIGLEAKKHSIPAMVEELLEYYQANLMKGSG